MVVTTMNTENADREFIKSILMNYSYIENILWYKSNAVASSRLQFNKSRILDYHCHLRNISNIMSQKVHTCTDTIVGIGYYGSILASSISSMLSKNLSIIKTLKYNHKTASQAKMGSLANEICLVDFCLYTGKRLLQASRLIRSAGGSINNIIVLADMEKNGRKNLESAGLKVDAIFNLTELRR